MPLSKLGDYIELVDERNSDALYGVNNLRGISINKIFTPTKADTSNLNLKPYKIVKHNWFAYCTVTSRNGNKISLAYNDGEDCIVSSINPVFKVKDETKLLPRYLMMFFNRSEFDRYARFNSWGSARETFSWDDFCNIELEIPSIETQKKYVAIYEGMLANLRSYEKGLDDLKLVCDGYIEELRRKIPSEEIGKYIIDTSTKNKDMDAVIAGISKEQKLISSDSRTSGVDKSKYFIVKNNEFAYSPIHINDGSIAFNNTGKTYIVSPIYKTFKVVDETKLLSKYLMLWFARGEFVRYCWFYAFGSARDSFEWNQFCNVKIPIPSIEKQKAIVEVLDILNYRKTNVDVLKKTISTICPILIRGSIDEANGVKR